MTTKQRILRAAMELAETRDSIHGVTISFESVAERAGLTKPGLMYHYPTKEALMEGLVRHASQSWAALLEQYAGCAATGLSVWERHRAYLYVATQTPHTRADYWVLSDALYHPTLLTGWREHLDPWLNTTEAPTSAVPLLTSVRFLADGAWISAATGLVSEAEVTRVIEHGLALIEQAEALTALEEGTA